MTAGREQTVITVLGPVPAASLGITMMHEHLLIDLTCNWAPPDDASRDAVEYERVSLERLGLLRRNALLLRDNCILDDLGLAIEELTRFKSVGGDTIVDVTLPDIGRDMGALQAASRATGVHVVAGCGHYVYPAHPASVATEPEHAIAARLVDELTSGVGRSDVRPGIIGEIGTSDPLHPDEVKVLRACACAARRTGSAITLHVISRLGHEVLNVLEEEGADLTRVVVGHQDLLLTLPPGENEDDVADYLVKLAARGCTVQLDTFGKEHWFPPLAGSSTAFRCPSDGQRLQLIVQLLEAGLASQLAVSQDVCHKSELVAYGGFGYAHILGTIVPALEDMGVGSEEIRTMLVDNPRRLLVPSA